MSEITIPQADRDKVRDAWDDYCRLGSTPSVTPTYNAFEAGWNAALTDRKEMLPKLIELLSEIRDCCLFTDDDGVGITTETHISEDLFGRICDSINSSKKVTK